MSPPLNVSWPAGQGSGRQLTRWSSRWVLWSAPPLLSPGELLFSVSCRVSPRTCGRHLTREEGGARLWGAARGRSVAQLHLSAPAP